jgi:hypothetical protein
MKARYNERKRHSFILTMFCIALTVTGLWFPSWHMHIVIACAICLAAMVAIFLLITILFVLVWTLTRFMTKGEN